MTLADVWRSRAPLQSQVHCGLRCHDALVWLRALTGDLPTHVCSADITRTTMQSISTVVASFFDGPSAYKTLYWQGIGFVPADEATSTTLTAQGNMSGTHVSTARALDIP